jgi:hypothetical protein
LWLWTGKKSGSGFFFVPRAQEAGVTFPLLLLKKRHAVPTLRLAGMRDGVNFIGKREALWKT